MCLSGKPPRGFEGSPVSSSDLVLSLEAIIGRVISVAPVELRALMIAAVDGGGDIAAWRLALRIIPELDAAGWRFVEGWTERRSRAVTGGLDDVITDGLVSAGWLSLVSAAAGEQAGIRSAARAVAAHLDSHGIRPSLALKAAE
jgi:hypothetical protein